MPELPEVETTKTSLLPLLGQTVQQVEVRQHSLRWPIPEDLNRLAGQKLIQLTRRSKYIVAQFEQDSMLWHLGMSGSFRLCSGHEELRKHLPKLAPNLYCDVFTMGAMKIALRNWERRKAA